MLAKAVASTMPTTFFNITASTIVSKWRGDSEKIIKVLFELARHYQPSTIFLDEIDSIMSNRKSDEHEGSRRMKTELLIQLDGLNKKETEKVFLLAASNIPWDLDQALLRRLEKRIFIGFPKDEERKLLLMKKLDINKLDKKFDFVKIASMLNGYSGSDITMIIKAVKMKTINRQIEEREKLEKKEKIIKNDSLAIISQEDIEEVISKIHPSSVLKEEKYLNWTKQHGSD